MIKLYLNTFFVCTITAILLLITACILQAFCLFPFIVSILLSVFCSLIVVSLTTWLQFKHEQKRINREITVQIKQIVSKICYFKSNASYKPPSPFFEGKAFLDKAHNLNDIENMISSCINIAIEQTYIFRKKDTHRKDMLHSLFLSISPLMNLNEPNFVQLADDCITELKNAVVAHLYLAEEGYYKEQLEKWVKNYDGNLHV